MHFFNYLKVHVFDLYVYGNSSIKHNTTGVFEFLWLSGISSYFNISDLYKSKRFEGIVDLELLSSQMLVQA